MKSVNARLFNWMLAVALGLATTSTLFAQGGKGVVTGTVMDPSGAAIPNAIVTLTNEGTGIVRTAATNTAGLYRFDFADVGSYTLKASAQGFADFEVAGLIVTVGQTVTNDVHMELARGTVQTITVEAGGVQLVQTARSDVSGLVDRNTLSQLPLEVRDPSAFVNLMPGSVPSALGNIEFNGSTRGAAVNGSRGGTGNFIIDGFDNNDQGQGGRSHNTVGTIPGAITGISPDAIQEFRVETNSFTAQYGRQSGFVADAVMKSGTNTLHGSVFEYNRNQSITANDFFSNRNGTKDSLVRNQFGGSLGGPIRKDKTFIFGAVEIQRMRQGAPNVVTSITPQFVDFVRSGGYADFMETDPNGACMQVLGATCPGAFDNSRTLGPIASDLVNKYPYPAPTSNFSNETGGYFPAIFGVPITYPVNVFGDADVRNNTKLNENRFSIKVDHTIGDRDRLTGLMAFDDYDTVDSSLGTDGLGSPYFPITALSRAQNWGLSYTHTFSPSILNEAKISFLRHNSEFPRDIDPNVPSIIPALDPTGVGIGMTSGLPQNFTDNQFQYQDHIAITRGKHSFNVGAEYRRTRNGSIFNASEFGFVLPWDIENLLTDGWAAADFENAAFGEPFLGSYYLLEASINPQTGEKPEYYRGYRANELGFYVQDDWKVASRLTLNLGLRWDYFGVPHNFRPGLDSNFFFGEATVPIDTTSDNPFFPRNSVPYAREATAAFQQRDHELWNKDKNNFAPRFGFAWDITGNQKTVLRGGFGVYYDRMWNNLFENIRFNPPLFSFNDVGFLINGVAAGPVVTPDLYSIPIVTSAYNNPAYQPKPSPRHMDQNMVAAYTEQVHMGIQHELGNNMMVEFNYIGTFGHKLTGVVDLNTFPGRIAGDFSSRRPNNTIGSDNARGNYFNSNYHAFQFQLTKRMSRGLQFQSNYTWSKALDYVSDAFNNRAASGNNGISTMDVMNRALDYGRADFDLRHRFVSSVIYDLPFFRSNRWAGGWRIGSIVSIQSGLPFNIYDGNADTNGDGKFIDRPDFTGNGNPDVVAVNHSVSPADGYLRTQYFEDAVMDPKVNDGLWRDGRLGRNTLTGPGYANLDFTVNKAFRLTERASISVQFNFFNIFNRSNFALPENNMASNSFGQSTATFGPRIGQFAARIDF
ncbi:MAG: TonB-dependent receptor domain-containing protein [Terriglobia bacterium]